MGGVLCRADWCGSLDMAALRQLADHELGIGVDEEAVSRRALACLLDAGHQVLQRGDEGPVLSLVVGHAATEIEADQLLLACSGFQMIACEVQCNSGKERRP